MPRSHPRLLPGFGLTLGITLTHLSLIVLLPLAALALKAASLSWPGFLQAVAAPRVLASYRLSFGTSFLAALINAAFGLPVAWVLCRYRFPGRRLLDALIDLPFALPTAVAGIALTTLYARRGWFGQHLPFDVAYTPLGITVALVFVGLPFVVRTLQPVLDGLGRDVEEAAASLGASRAQILLRVILPELAPALLTGFALAFARGIGEYGSVVFISGNLPMRTEVAPLLIITRLEQYEFGQATAIAVVMLGISFTLLLGINLLHRRISRRLQHV